ncbi:hypothetical protein PO909_032766 [Leuciscus waleckii]
MEGYFDYFPFYDNGSFPCDGNENCTELVFPSEMPLSEIGSRHWFSLVCYSIVFLLGVPGNGLVVWVTAFRMPNSVNAQWFLNLAIADLLCCLSLPLLMVPLAQDQHWPFGDFACKLLNGLFYMMMYCSVLLLVVISLDRFLLVTKPVWCQNHRHPRQARSVCVVVWILALLGGSPQFALMEAYEPLEGLPHDELRETKRQRQVGPDAACHPGGGAQLLPMLDSPTDRGCSAVGDVRTVRTY